MADAVISAVIQALADILIEKVFNLYVEDEMELLKDELTRMQAFLKDANKKQAEDERVRNWISEITEVALDAEDTIEMSTLSLETAKSRGLLQCCPCFPHVRHFVKIRKEIQSIRARLAKIGESRETFGIKDLGESGEPTGRSEVEVRRRLAPWHKDEHLVGMEDDVKNLLEPIMDRENKGLFSVAVVGAGGIGKSTLARQVYNHPDVVSGFDCRGWVVVSSEFTLLETIKQLILEMSTPEQEKEERLQEMKKLYMEDQLKELLHQQLEWKRYFIVLDDVREMEHFDSLNSIFPNKQGSSRLLFTTRSKDIGNQCRILHEMRLLDSQKSWELFLKKGLVNSNEEFPNELEHIGRQIVEKCEGLPLAITVMGGLLAEVRSSEDEWQEALNQLNSHLVRAKNSFSAILELSYQNLSPQLRSCFLCFAFFKEDDTIPVKRLVNIMVRQGLIQCAEGATTEEEIARGYLDKLINRNMVQVTGLSLDNQIKSCHIHYSLHDICLQKAKGEIGFEVLKGGDRISLNKPRHCIAQWDDLVSFPINKKKHIRSLFLLNTTYNIKEITSSYWKSFQFLKSLDLDGNFDDMRLLPDSFRLLHGLKQLRINGSLGRRIDLPTWLSTLIKLEILDLSNFQVRFPDVAIEMNSLRHIYAGYISGLKISGGSKNIETIKVISKKNWMRNSLKMKGDDNCLIRKLGIDLDDDGSLIEISEESLRMRASLEELKNLVKLYLWWEYPPMDITIITPRATNLTKLKLFGNLTKCPSASMLPPNLSHLTMDNSYLCEDPMQELSKLPKLSYLKLRWDSYMGEKMQVLHDGFPRLRGLSLQGLFELRTFEVEEGGMPQLKLLRVDHCRHLDTENLSNKSYQLQISR